MDNMQIMIIISGVVIVGVIIFALTKILDAIKLLGENINKVALDSKNSISNDLKVLSETIEKVQLTNQNRIEESIQKVNNLINAKSEQLNHNFVENQVSFLEHINNLKLVLQDGIKIFKDDVNKYQLTNTNQIDSILIENKKALTQSNENLQVAIVDKINLLNNDIVANIEEVKKDTKSFKIDFEKYQLNNKNQLENNFQNTVQLVNNLRLDNLINVANEIGKYKNGVVEDEHFLQEVGHCKIIKFTDKQTNEVTNVYYDENGEKSYTQTYLGDYLKYEMIYKNGLISQGSEFNNLKQIIFAYQYDEAGEVSVKIEYEYDTYGNQIEKSRIIY